MQSKRAVKSPSGLTRMNAENYSAEGESLPAVTVFMLQTIYNTFRKTDEMVVVDPQRTEFLKRADARLADFMRSGAAVRIPLKGRIKIAGGKP